MRLSLSSIFARRRRFQSLAAAVFLFFTVLTLYSLRNDRAGSPSRLSAAPPAGVVSVLGPDPGLDPGTVPDPDSNPASAPDTNPESTPDTDSASTPDTDLESTPDTDPESASGTDPVSDPYPVSRVVPDPTPTPAVRRPPARGPALQFPSEYAGFPESSLSQSDRCGRLFTPRYFEDFRSHAIQYCAGGSRSALQCFQGHSRPNQEVDSICIGQGAVFDVAKQKFALDCDVRRLDENERKQGLLPFDSIRGEWYNTGPRWILDHHVDLKRTSKPAAGSEDDLVSQASPKFVLFVQREGAGNLWHCMTEIMTMTMTFDLLQTTADPSRNNTPFFTRGPDVANTQVIVTDDHDDGIFFDLWSIFAGRPPLRWNNLVNGSDPEQARIFTETPHNLIIPLPGAANPIWQSDWDEQNCTWAPIVNVFANRILQAYGIPTTDEAEQTPTPDDPLPPINLTFVDRTGNRRLINHDALLAAVEAKHPHVRTQAIDFATISFEEQLRLVRSTDVFVGVHGAAFTHVMFMRPGRGAVVEIQPETNDYRGFRNLGFLKGLTYIMGHGEQVQVKPGEKMEGEAKRRRGVEEPQLEEGGGRGLTKRAQWHWDDVRIGEEGFMNLIDEAVAAVEEQRRGT